MSCERPLLALCALLAAALAFAPAPAAAAAGAFVERDAAAGAERFWTPERLRQAKPLVVARAGADAVRARRAAVPFAAGPVADPTVFPNSANGKLYGFQRGFGEFECSATVVSTPARSVVFTAGHCVYDPRAGVFAKRFLFVPASGRRGAPYGSWSWASVITTRQWVRRENFNFDYAAMELAPRASDGARVEDVVGSRPLTPNTPAVQSYTAVGYPSNRDDGQTMWSCASAYAGIDPRARRHGRPPMAIGCDMGTGASGGGWFTSAGGLASVSSFGYVQRPDLLYGPQLGARAARLVSRAAAG